MPTAIEEALLDSHHKGVLAERIRVRRDLLAWMSMERRDGRALTPARLLKALDLVLPEEG